jgi:methyltransferase (TIGR00027 family)
MSMKLPNLSYMVKIGQLRYIQSRYESGGYRSPDHLSHELLSPGQIVGAHVRGVFRLDHLRRNPFYYYVLARTKYYDDVFCKAIELGFDAIVNIGCGSDTRAHRFAAELRRAGCNVIECDQATAIETKRQLAGRKWPADQVVYQAIDLNDSAWPQLEAALRPWRMVLVMMEGVSPYIDQNCFAAFLDFLARNLPAMSRIAYDFKLRGSADDFGRQGRTIQPFRLPADESAVTEFHRRRGLIVDHFAQGSEMSLNYLPTLESAAFPLFTADALVQLRIAR